MKDISFYWNTMSEMFIPTSVWDQSHEFEYGIFEVLEADSILEMMKDIFNNKMGIHRQYIIDPFTYSMQFAFRNSFDEKKDEYKYKFKIKMEKMRMNLTPQICKDINWYR